MRTVVILDTKIDKDEALALLDDYSDFLEENTGIIHEFWVERRDFSQVPTVVESDGDMKPEPAYRKMLTDSVHKRYADYGTDNVVMWVHEDNFLYKGIWGQNWSYIYHKYSFQLCRWDKDNTTNTFNTLLHEIAHSADAVIKKETGIEIDEIISAWILKNGPARDKAYIKEFGFNWDRDYVHGALPSVQYIGRSGYKYTDANLRILVAAAPYLSAAYEERKEKHLAPLKAVQWQVIKLLSTWLAGLKK